MAQNSQAKVRWAKKKKLWRIYARCPKPMQWNSEHSWGLAQSNQKEVHLWQVDLFVQFSMGHGQGKGKIILLPGCAGTCTVICMAKSTTACLFSICHILDDTAAYPTDYATSVVDDPILTEQDKDPSVADITDSPPYSLPARLHSLKSTGLAHGSNSSTSRAWLQRVIPTTVKLSAPSRHQLCAGRQVFFFS